MNTPTGYTRGDWFNLLREVNYSVERKYFSRAFQVTVFSFMNSRYKKQEDALYGNDAKKLKIESPIFILGHWRNGTTLLHELMAMDKQFAFPNHFEISRPSTFLVREPVIEQQAQELEQKKRPMDNMTVTYRSPGEDEAGLAVLSQRSPLVGWVFPKYEDRYDRYLTFRDVPAEDLQRWKDSIVLFMQKLTYRYKRPLIMKSPTHTARIKILLDLFPDARFIHIHRNPFTVFQSTLKLYNTAVHDANLHDPNPGGINSGILRRYKDMYTAFFEERDLVPADRFIEISFEDLEKDKLGSLRQIYAHLGLPGYEEALPGFNEYLNRTQGYKKNKFEQIPEPLRCEVASAWERCFEEWGYSTQPASLPS